MQRDWFIKYIDKQGKPQKMYGKLKHFTTLQERLKEAKKLIKEILDPEKNTDHQRHSLIKSLLDLLEEKKPTLALKIYQAYLSQLKKFAA